MPPEEAVSVDDVLAAMAASRVGILAFRNSRDQPLAWPITPYVDADQVAVTSTAAFLRKAERIRRDPRVSILAGGVMASGCAKVVADPTGERFVDRLLTQERAKFPPLRQIESVPGHRRLFAWYFARAHILLHPSEAVARPGNHAFALVTLDAHGLPDIWPLPTVSEPDLQNRCIDLGEAVPQNLRGSAVLLAHAEDDEMRQLRAMHLRGRLLNGQLTVERRSGSLATKSERPWQELRTQLELYRRGRAGRRRLRAWSGD